MRDRHLLLANWDVEEAVRGFLTEEAKFLGIQGPATLRLARDTGYTRDSSGPVKSVQVAPASSAGLSAYGPVSIFLLNLGLLY